MRIAWDLRKAHANQLKHHLTFEEARSLFERDINYLVIYDAEPSNDEDRFVAIGPIRRGIITVVFIEQTDDSIRIISARRATGRERTLFRRHIGGST